MWLKGTVKDRAVFVRAEPLSRGRSLFVEQKGGAWTAYSARMWLDAPGKPASADDASWAETTVSVASGGAGARYFDTW